jgi:hypothetical protein
MAVVSLVADVAHESLNGWLWPAVRIPDRAQKPPQESMAGATGLAE